jgi:prolyl-tRNA synthetase
MEGVAQAALAALEDLQGALLERALEFRRSHTARPSDYEGLRAAVAEGFAHAWWCGSEECEARVKEETKATIRCIPLEQPDGEGECVVCGQPAAEEAVFARAY